MRQRSSTAPSPNEVLQQGKPVLQQLDDLLSRLTDGGQAVTDEDCVAMAARLRGLARVFDRHAPSRPTPTPADAPSSDKASRTWVFPGQMR